MHGIPGIIGTIVSAIAAASYNSTNTVDIYNITTAQFPDLETLQTQPFKQGGLQIAALFTSIGIAIVTGVISGFVLKCFYTYRSKEFFNDGVYFEEAEEFLALEGHEQHHSSALPAATS